MPTWEIITPNGTKQVVTADNVTTLDNGKTMKFYNYEGGDGMTGAKTVALVTTGPGVVAVARD